MNWIRTLRYKFMWLPVLWSPFKLPKLKLYIGKVAIGVPYFFPRRWVKFTNDDALRKAEEEVNNKNLIHYGKNPQELVESYKRYKKPIPRKIGFDIVGLGWKTKWTDTDYRFEYNPLVSFVCFGLQLVITIVPPESDNYWKCWLYYHLDTDKSNSKQERIQQCRTENPCIWTRHTGDTEETIDYYEKILRKKFVSQK